MQFSKIIKVLSLVFLAGIQSCYSQAKTNPETVHIKDFNWTVTIPENFQLIEEREWDETEKQGQDAIEETFGEELVNQAVTIFAYKNDRFNNFEANWQPYDPEIDGEYQETYHMVNEILYQTFESQMPGAKLDSVTSKQQISGLEFRRFDITIDFPNGVRMKTIGFSRLFGEREFTVNITYIDEKIGKKMLDAFLGSRFE